MKTIEIKENFSALAFFGFLALVVLLMQEPEQIRHLVSMMGWGGDV